MWKKSLIKAVSFSLLAMGFSLLGGRPAFPITWTQTTDAEFNLGTKNNVTVTGTGLNGSVALAFGSFPHRREISLNNAAGDSLKDYQIKVVLNSGSFDFSKAKPAGEDIRFLDSDDSTWLHYWIEAWDNTAQTAVVWVRVPSISADSTKTIYMYYGDPDAVDATDGAATFDFFDDFNNLNSWSQSGNGISANDGVVTLNNDSYGNPTLWTDFNIPGPFWAEVKYRQPSRYRNRLYLVPVSGPGLGYDYGIFEPSIYWNGWTGTNLSPDTWYIVQWGNTPTDYVWRILGLDGEEVLNRTHGSAVPDLQRLSFSATDSPNSVYSLDWARVRKYAASEPVVSVGTEGPSSRRIGVFLSSAYDTGQWSAYDILSWNAEAPAGTSLGFQIRTGDTQNELLRSPWYGPGGTSDFYQTSGNTVNPIHLNRRWVQYLIFLGTTDAVATPAVNSVSITYAGLGEVAITSDTAWPEGTYHLNNLTVSNGAVFTVGGGSTISASGTITVTGNATIVLQGKNNTGLVNGQWAGLGVTLEASQITVDAGSKISADGQGYTTGNGPGGSGGTWCGASYGGVGGCKVPVYGSSLFPVDLGSAGGGAYGGWSNGGGAIRLNVTGTLQLDGEITAKGIRSPGGNSWGGAGGSIYVTTGVLRGNGKFSADGAESSGGGRVSVYYGVGSAFNGFLASTALAPNPGYPDYATNGTVGFFDTAVTHSHLKIYKDFTLDQDSSLTFEAVTVSDSGILTIGGGSLIRILGDLSVSGSSKVVPEGKYTNGLVGGQWAGVGVTIYAANATVEAGSQITATGQGYTTSNGPGGTVAWFTGGSYGGQGSGQSGPTYGSETRPVDLGSAGSAVYGGWSRGGGAIRLNVNNTLTVNGEIKADGDDTSVGGNVGGGAGGSIFIAATNLAGSGSIQANGQTGNSGSGGGGRVAIYYSNLRNLPPENVAAAGGTGAGNGTIYISNTPVFELTKPKDSLVHDMAAVEWQALAANPATTADVLVFGSGQQLINLGLRLPGIGSTSWDTRTIPDGSYELRITFRDGPSNIITEITKKVLVNNAVSWHGGLIEANQTWTSNRVQVVEGNLVIASGVRVTIEPGTVVKLAKGAKIIVQDGGLLDAQGTPTQPIIFTSLADDTAAGDTNLDGGSSLPLPGDWFGIVVNSGGQFANNEFTAIRYVLTTHSGNLLQDESWMGTFTHHITDQVFISDGVTLTINPGAVIKFDASKKITVQQGGRLVAEGTVASPITFTSIKDDSVGGDTNGDGNSTLPAPGDWQSIVVDGAQATLNHVDVRYGGALPGPQQTAMFVISGTNPVFTLKNSTIRESLYDGVAGHAGTTLVENTVLTGIDRAIGSFSGSITVVNSTLDNNRIGLLVHGGVLNVSNTIVTNSFETGVRCDLGCYSTYKYNNVWTPPHPGYQNYQVSTDPTGTNGNLSVDPMYKNRVNRNYRLNYRSPCIDTADGTAAPATDFMGASRYSDPRTPIKKGIPAANGAYADQGAFEFVETAQSDVDLVLTSLQGPSTALAGETVTLQWTISNIGPGKVMGPWHDSVYLVRDAYTNPVELFAGEVLVGQGVILGPGQTYTASAQIRVPGSNVGNHHWLVKVNSRGEIFEGMNWENNEGISAGPVYIDLPELVINSVPLSRQFAEVGQSHWFKFNPTAGQDVLVQLDLLNNAGTTELYIGRGYMPDPSHFDFRSGEWNAPDVTALASGTSTQTYYVMAYARTLTGSPAGFSIKAGTVGFSINVEGPGSVGNGGKATLKLTGGQLRQDMTYEIVDCNGGAHPAVSVFFVNSSLVYATFDLTGLPACSYSVRARYQGNTAVSGTPVAVTQAAPGRIAYSLDAPRAIRPDWKGTVTIHYRNVGNTDAMAPLMWVTADQLEGDGNHSLPECGQHGRYGAPDVGNGRSGGDELDRTPVRRGRNHVSPQDKPGRTGGVELPPLRLPQLFNWRTSNLSKRLFLGILFGNKS